MKKKYVKQLSLVLCSTLLIGGSIGGTVYAMNSEDKTNIIEKPVLTVVEENAPVVKNETVYVLTDADGKTKKVIVSDWLKNALNAGSITDLSGLSNLEIVKGDATFSQDGNNLVWNAAGSDVYYQGTSEQALPVDVKITYTLNGATVTAQEIAGKSGKVTIRFDYTNNTYETKQINGKEEKIYVPFAMLTGLILDNETFQNVTVEGGKLINDGDRLAIVGVAFPGMQESLGIEADKLELPSHFEITADVTNFELPNSVTVATNEVFNKVSFDGTDSVASLTGSLTELTDAMTQLMDGSDALYDGLTTLLTKSETLVDGIHTLSTGLNTLTANNDALNNGSKQVFESLLSMANTQLAAAGLDAPTLTIENYGTVLDGVINSLSDANVSAMATKTAKDTVTAAVNAQKDAVTAGVTAAVKEEVSKQVSAAVQAEVEKKVTAAVTESVEAQVLATLNMNKDTYQKAVAAGMVSAEDQAKVEGAIKAQMASDAVKGIISAKTAEQMASDEVAAILTAKTNEQMNSETVKSLIATKTEEQVALLIEQNLNSPEVQEKIAAAKDSAKSGVATLKSLKAQLDSYNQFYTGLNQYTAGVSQVYAGVKQMEAGTPALVEGITALKDGAGRLSEGLSTFNEEGVEKLVSAVDGDLTGLFDRINAIAEVSRGYKSYSGINEDCDGSVKFIFRTDAISADNQ